MDAGNKTKRQMTMIGVLVAVILGVVAYMNREVFIPESTSPLFVIVPVVRQPIPPEKTYDELFESVAFKTLKAFGDIPVKPGKMGSEDPFGEFIE